MSYKKIHPLTVVTKGKISYIDQNHFLYQAVNIFFSAVKLGILTWGVYGIDSLLEPASSGQSMNCSFSHFRVGFKRGSGGCRLVETHFYQTCDMNPSIVRILFTAFITTKYFHTSDRFLCEEKLTIVKKPHGIIWFRLAVMTSSFASARALQCGGFLR